MSIYCIIIICIPIAFNDPINSCFSNKKYSVKIQTRNTHILNSVFLIETSVLIRFLKIICVKSQLDISFGTALVCNEY